MHKSTAHANPLTSQFINFAENGHYFRNMYVMVPNHMFLIPKDILMYYAKKPYAEDTYCNISGAFAYFIIVYDTNSM